MPKYTIQFLTESTGYIPGTIPPRFDDSHKKPIAMCGSSGTLHADGRLSLATVCAMARDRVQEMQRGPYRHCIGFQIVAYNPGYGPDRVIRGPVLIGATA